MVKEVIKKEAAFLESIPGIEPVFKTNLSCILSLMNRGVFLLVGEYMWTGKD